MSAPTTAAASGAYTCAGGRRCARVSRGVQLSSKRHRLGPPRRACSTSEVTPPQRPHASCSALGGAAPSGHACVSSGRRVRQQARVWSSTGARQHAETTCDAAAACGGIAVPHRRPSGFGGVRVQRVVLRRPLARDAQQERRLHGAGCGVGCDASSRREACASCCARAGLRARGRRDSTAGTESSSERHARLFVTRAVQPALGEGGGGAVARLTPSPVMNGTNRWLAAAQKCERSAAGLRPARRRAPRRARPRTPGCRRAGAPLGRRHAALSARKVV
jgi:hypothetical protein